LLASWDERAVGGIATVAEGLLGHPDAR
jgi:hypothetical protein